MKTPKQADILEKLEKELGIDRVSIQDSKNLKRSKKDLIIISDTGSPEKIIIFIKDNYKKAKIVIFQASQVDANTTKNLNFIKNGLGMVSNKVCLPDSSAEDSAERILRCLRFQAAHPGDKKPVRLIQKESSWVA